MKRRFNINDTVEIRLTPHGRRILEREWPMRIPEETNGVSQWQLWELMQIFGPHCGQSKKLPFKTTVQIDERFLK